MGECRPHGRRVESQDTDGRYLEGDNRRPCEIRKGRRTHLQDPAMCPGVAPESDISFYSTCQDTGSRDPANSRRFSVSLVSGTRDAGRDKETENPRVGSWPQG